MTMVLFVCLLGLSFRSDKRTIKEYFHNSLKFIDKICEEAGIRHAKAVGLHYQLRLVNSISTYDETAIAKEIKVPCV